MHLRILKLIKLNSIDKFALVLEFYFQTSTNINLYSEFNCVKFAHQYLI